MTGVEPFDVAILAGGAGTRLRERTGRLPKPMVPLLGRPLLEHQLELSRRHGFQRVLLLVHYKHAVIEAHFGDGSRHGVTLGYQIEETPRGTAGALRDALPRLANTFLVIYGDTYLDVDLRRLWHAHAVQHADATLFLHPNDHPQDSDLVEVNADGLVTAIHPYPHQDEGCARNLVNAALYVMERNGLEERISADGQADLARDTFPRMLGSGARLYGYRSPEYVKDVGTPERLDRVTADIEAGVTERLSGRELRRAVFLDRDGTINKDVNHLKRPEDLDLLDGAAGAVQRLNRGGYLAVVVTNQAVVARGEVTFAGLERIHARLEHLLGQQRVYLDGIYACPHHPDRGFPGEVPELKVTCDCRKPATGLIDAACRDLGIGRRESWFIGDTTSDVEAGRRAALRTVLLRTGRAGQDGRFPVAPDYVVADLACAVSWILDGHPAMLRRITPVAARALTARLVVIGGLARTGKSSVAQVVKEAVSALGRTAHVLPLDSWLKPLAERAEGTGVAARYDVEAMLAAVTQLARSRARMRFELPIYDRANRAMYERRVHLPVGPEDLLIVEGVPALLVEGLTRLADVRVHVEMPEAERVSRLRADYRWRGMSDPDVDVLLASRAIDETAPVERARTHADFVIPAWTAA